MLQRVIVLIGRLNEFIGKAASFLILALIGIIVFEVLSRYFFNAPTKWSNEISQYLLAGVVMLGGAFCLVHNEHVRVDIFYRNFRRKNRVFVEVLTCLLVLSFVSAMVWKGSELCVDAFVHDKRSMTILELPLFPSMVLVPIGAALLGLQSIANALLAVLNLWTSRSSVEEEG